MLPLLTTIREGSGTARIEALSDGLFAVALTVLALELEPPSLPPGASGKAVLEAFGDTLHIFEFYLISFFIIGFYWYLHHQMYRFIARHDTNLIVLNFLALLPITVVSFLTELAGDYSAEPEIVALYFVALSFTGMIFAALWLHAARGRRLTESGLPDGIIRLMTLKALIPATVFMLGAGVAFLHVGIARKCYLLLLLAWLASAAASGWFQRRYSRGENTANAPAAGAPAF